MKVTSCRACEEKKFAPILDLGETALANKFVKPEDADAPEAKYPLRLVLCESCGLLQIDEEVSPEELFSDYIYVSGTSDLVFRHAEWLAQQFSDRYNIGSDDLVVEAASNDGTVLEAFSRRGAKTVGIEPAKNIVPISIEKGIETVCEFFGADTAPQIRSQYGPAKLVLARHVLAHVADLRGFVAGMESILADDGIAVVEVPHLVPFYENVEYDTVYHEHLCYFSVRVLQSLFARHGLQVIDVDQVLIHGGSIVVTAQKKGGPHTRAAKVSRMISQEEQLGLHRSRAWDYFVHQVEQNKELLIDQIHRLSRSGQQVAAYGAPAKGNTLLAYCGIDSEQICFTVDKSPLKQNLLTPGHHIPIHAPEKLLEDQPDATLVLAWNFAEEIVRQQKEYVCRGGRFLLPLPTPYFWSSQLRKAS